MEVQRYYSAAGVGAGVGERCVVALGSSPVVAFGADRAAVVVTSAAWALIWTSTPSAAKPASRAAAIRVPASASPAVRALTSKIAKPLPCAQSSDSDELIEFY